MAWLRVRSVSDWRSPWLVATVSALMPARPAVGRPGLGAVVPSVVEAHAGRRPPVDDASLSLVADLAPASIGMRRARPV